MSRPTQEQIVSAQKANLDTLCRLTGRVADGVGRLIQLNLKATRALLTEVQNNVLMSLSAKEPGEWIAQQATPAASIHERVQSYNREVFEIVSGVEAEFARLAQAQCEAYTTRTQTLVDEVAKNAPAGYEAAIAAWKSAITATNTLVETLQKTGQQAVEVAKSNFDIATEVAPKTARRAVEQASTGVKR
jgi:phasin family protein